MGTARRGTQATKLWRVGARAVASGLLIASASGCMWVLSPCEDKVGATRPSLDSLIALLTAADRLPPPGTAPVFYEHVSLVWVDGDGTVRFFNGNYPWCQRMSEGDLERLRGLVDGLSPSPAAAKASGDAIREGFPGERVELRLPPQDGRTSGGPGPVAVHWRADRPGAASDIAVLDEIACLIERSLGGGYRGHIERNHRAYLEARGRERACRPGRRQAGRAVSGPPAVEAHRGSGLSRAEEGGKRG